MASPGSQDATSPHSLKETSDLFELLDSLKALDLEDHVTFPQLVACGSQSVGKSSVLEALCDIPFPTSGKVCTRFATEVQMRHGVDTSVVARIQPGPDATPNTHQRLTAWAPTLIQPSKPGFLAGVFAQAAEAMGVANAGFSTSKLVLEFTGPRVLPLSLVDLPGLFAGRGSEQTRDEAPLVRSLVENYVRSPRTIVLAVISASFTLPSQDITSVVEDCKAQARTMGIITRPDFLEKEPDQRDEFLKLANNDIMACGHKWHVVRNRGTLDRGSSLDDWRPIEERELAEGVFKVIPAAFRGMSRLADRVRELQLAHIKATLPGLSGDVAEAVAACEAQRQQLEQAHGAPMTPDDLVSETDQLRNIIDQAVNGSYLHTFFWRKGGAAKLFQRIESIATAFGEDLRKRGHRYQIISPDAPVPAAHPAPTVFETASLTTGLLSNSPLPVIKSQAAVIGMLMPRLGRMQDGQFDAQLASDLYYDQASKWPELVAALVKDVMVAVESFMRMSLEFTIRETSDAQVESLWAYIVGPALQSIRNNLQQSADKLLSGHLDKRTIDFSQVAKNEIPAARHQELQRVCRVLQGQLYTQSSFSNSSSPYPPPIPPALSETDVFIKNLLETDIGAHTACAEAITCMQKHYKAQRTRLELAFDIQELKRAVLDKLPQLFEVAKLRALAGSGEWRESGKRNTPSVELDEVTSKLARLKSAQEKLAQLSRRGPMPAHQLMPATHPTRASSKKRKHAEVVDSDEEVNTDMYDRSER